MNASHYTNDSTYKKKNNLNVKLANGVKNIQLST